MNDRGSGRRRDADGVEAIPDSPSGRSRKGPLIFSLVLIVLFGFFLINDLASGSYARAAFGVIVEALCVTVAYRELRAIRGNSD